MGPFSEVIQAHPDFLIHDLGSVLLLPGFVNAHAHLELSDRTPGQPPASLVDWLLGLMAESPPAGGAGDARLLAATRSGIAQCLQFGVTTVGDITRHPVLTRAAIGQSPLRAVSFGEVTAMAGRRPLLAGRIAAAMEPAHRAPRVTAAVSPHAPYSIEADGYMRCVSAALAAGVPIASHLAESADESEFLACQTGPFRQLWDTLGGWTDDVPRFAGGPIRLAKHVGLLDTPQSLLVHVNYADDDELELLASGKASVIYCPRTHDYFGHPPHRWRDMLDRGINVAIGTDSAASSPDLNLLDDLRWVHRLAPDFPLAELWSLGTTRAAKALGMAGRVGVLAAGAFADLIAFPVSGSNPLRNVLESDEGAIGVWIGGDRVG